jgi:hypothetical protein
MVRIREKATESEAIVKNITKDIQSLDLAKKNLSQSMTALKRFQMLGSFSNLRKKERFFLIKGDLSQRSFKFGSTHKNEEVL